jgi:hypothetical protein
MAEADKWQAYERNQLIKLRMICGICRRDIPKGEPWYFPGQSSPVHEACIDPKMGRGMGGFYAKDDKGNSYILWSNMTWERSNFKP